MFCGQGDLQYMGYVVFGQNIVLVLTFYIVLRYTYNTENVCAKEATSDIYTTWK